MSLPVYDADAVRARLPMETCIDLMDAVQIALSRGEMVLPLRSHVPLDGDNSLLVMPGALERPPVFGAKLISLFPANGQAGLPTIQGQVLLFDGSDGTPLALVDASALTAIRTAAASAAATRALANPDASCLALLGYGVQADSHLVAMLAVRPLQTVRVWGPDPDKAAAFAERHRSASLSVEASTSVEAALAGADLVCSVSAARSPIIHAAWLREGCHLNLVGAHTRDAREADGATMAKARIFTEITAFALAEAGDLLLAIEEGHITEAAIAGEIGQVLAGALVGREQRDQITIYKSLGNTAQDLAAAHHVHAGSQRSPAGDRHRDQSNR